MDLSDSAESQSMVDMTVADDDVSSPAVSWRTNLVMILCQSGNFGGNSTSGEIHKEEYSREEIFGSKSTSEEFPIKEDCAHQTSTSPTPGRICSEVRVLLKMSR